MTRAVFLTVPRLSGIVPRNNFHFIYAAALFARTLAQRALAAAAIFALADALIFLFGFSPPLRPVSVVDFPEDRISAQRARAAAAMRARPAALIFRRRFEGSPEFGFMPAKIEPSSEFKASICSLISAARRS